jgi:hypothetical protein
MKNKISFKILLIAIVPTTLLILFGLWAYKTTSGSEEKSFQARYQEFKKSNPTDAQVRQFFSEQRKKIQGSKDNQLVSRFYVEQARHNLAGLNKGIALGPPEMAHNFFSSVKTQTAEALRFARGSEEAIQNKELFRDVEALQREVSEFEKKYFSKAYIFEQKSRRQSEFIKGDGGRFKVDFSKIGKKPVKKAE